LLCREDIAQNVVHGDADRADQNFTFCHAAIASASVVMIMVAPARKLGGGGCRSKRPKQPRYNKNNTSNFGPHRSMFLSMGFNQ
jgi:hypothetical protein